MDSIFLNFLLDRRVKVGCLFNYYNAKILPGTIRISDKDIQIEEFNEQLLVYQSITTEYSLKDRLSCIGINKNLRWQIDDQKMNMDRSWFANLLKDEAFDHKNEVHIIASLKVKRSDLYLELDYINSNIYHYHNRNGATHLVTDVDYGAEFVIWMHRSLNSVEVKEIIELNMREELGEYIGKWFRGDPNHPIPPKSSKAFDMMTCSFLSSIRNAGLRNGTFEECVQMIQELTDVDENDHLGLWHPIGMRIRRIPTGVEIRTLMDMGEDLEFELKQQTQWITQQCEKMIQLSNLHPVPVFLKKSLNDFEEVRKEMVSKIDDILYSMQQRHFSPKKCSEVGERFRKLLSFAFQWLSRFYKDVEFILTVLDKNRLPVIDLRSIKEQVKEGHNVKRTEVFVLHFSCVTTNLYGRFEEWQRYPDNFFLTVFDTEYKHKDGVVESEVCKDFQDFLNKALTSRPSDNEVDYVVGILSPKSPYKEGSVFTIGYEKSCELLTERRTPSDSSSAEGPRDTVVRTTEESI